MYRLMKREKFTLAHTISGFRAPQRPTEVDQFQQFRPALEVRESANNEGRFYFYILNESGQEYYGETWIE